MWEGASGPFVCVLWACVGYDTRRERQGEQKKHASWSAGECWRVARFPKPRVWQGKQGQVKTNMVHRPLRKEVAAVVFHNVAPFCYVDPRRILQLIANLNTHTHTHTHTPHLTHQASSSCAASVALTLLRLHPTLISPRKETDGRTDGGLGRRPPYLYR